VLQLFREELEHSLISSKCKEGTKEMKENETKRCGVLQ